MDISRKRFGSIIPFVYLLPSLAIITFIYLNSLVKVIFYSLVEWDGFTPTSKFNNFEKFKVVLSNPDFFTCFKNSITILVTVIPALIILGIVATQFMYMGIKGAKFFRFLFFIPEILPVVVVGILFSFFLQKIGPLNQLLRLVHLDALAVDWFANSRYSLWGLIIVIVWKDIGFPIVLFLSRLSHTSPSLYESARIDGAGEFRLLLNITIPELKDVIVLYSVLACIGNLTNLFPYIFVTTNGGPGYSSTVMEYFIYLHTFRYFYVGQGTAVAVLLFGITLVLSLFYFKLYDREIS